MGKNKLMRFAEMKTFFNVFEPALEEIISDSHPLRGTWNSTYFKNNNPITLELGCGKGEYSVGLGLHYPARNFIGVDIKGARMWRGAKTAIENKQSNVAFLRMRIDFIDAFFCKDEVSEIWLTFPDPQPGRNREKKRLTSPDFIARYRQFLTASGIIHLKTDNTGLFDYTLDVVKSNNFDLIFSTCNLYGGIDLFDEDTRDVLTIKTHYENKFGREGKYICYLKFRLN